MHEQARFRIFRIGQEKPTFVTSLLGACGGYETVSHALMRLHVSKRGEADRVLLGTKRSEEAASLYTYLAAAHTMICGDERPPVAAAAAGGGGGGGGGDDDRSSDDGGGSSGDDDGASDSSGGKMSDASSMMA